MIWLCLIVLVLSILSTIVLYFAFAMAGIQEKEAETSTGLESVQDKIGRLQDD